VNALLMGAHAVGDALRLREQLLRLGDLLLEGLDAGDGADRRNGHYRRSLLTELGDIELSRWRSTAAAISVSMISARARRPSGR
jgi:hypothetical protein